MKKKRMYGPYKVPFTHPGKVLFPDSGITKQDLISYYDRIAETMLPHMVGRPISMERYPDGIGEEGFYEKEVPDYFPEWIHRVRVDLKDGGHQDQVVCENTATLVYLAEVACITPHIWPSKKEELSLPDKLIFDLDPTDGDFEPVRRAAYLVREYLEDRDLFPFVMTTGSRGLHVVLPLRPEKPYADVRNFGTAIAKDLFRQHPDALTVKTKKEERKGRVFLDMLRNAYGQTSVAPYAVRAKPGAPVATPLDWKELERRDIHSQTYTVKNIFRRLGQKEDPWKDIYRHRYSPSHAIAEWDRQ
ncbi:MAG: non-homologous end-joining DNA ligase [Methanomicrobiaceae archaeon]|nr:non-homologous end-joining DNA ligase [Methanomicrobiaceae archaeon]